MTTFAFTDCCTMLATDPKTLRLWLAQANMPLQTHPTDARLKCLTTEQIWQLATLHARPIQPHACAETTHFHLSHEATPSQEGTALSASALQETDLTEKLAHLETEVVTMQHQMTQLAMALLTERERCYEGRLQALEERLQSRGNLPLSTSGLQTAAAPCQPDADPHRQWEWHPTERRARTPLIPLIEYGAAGTYVLISPEVGELPILADSPEWFAWLASLSSFRFVGRSGRFGARRGYNRRPNRSWYAQRAIHQKNYSKYIGISEHITTTRLEQVAADLQSCADLR